MLPLSGIRVLTVEQYGAGPFGTMLLADLGAEVIKIENPRDGGDMSRAVGPHFLDDQQPASLFFQAFNRNKRSVTLDLKAEAGRAVFHRLVESADAVANNLRGDQPNKLGLTYGDLAAVNRRIVCAHLTAYGRSGSRQAWPGFDYLMQAEAGYMSLTGEPEQPPTRFGLSIVDYMTGMAQALALSSALVGARQEGKGRDIDVSLFDVALHNLTYPAAWFLNKAADATRESYSRHPSLVPCRLFPTRDGWIFVMCNKEKFWPILAEALGHPEWGSDPRFSSFADRLANREQVESLLSEALMARDTADWLVAFAGQVPASPVLSAAEALTTDFVAERSAVIDYTGPNGARVHGVASPFRVPGETMPTRAAPCLGADTDEVLGDLGIGENQRARLRSAGVV